ncbi:MAG: zinc-ribbon and FHA domain-containing protein [Actinomycetota bacterium]|nr:zinc-ribbon and FHA domain-containing protein [Actinomycetota bacterium]
MSVFCTHCGHRNPDDSRFCSNCGRPLEGETTLSVSPIEVEDDSSTDVHVPQEDLQPGQALLVVRRGPNQGSTFLLDAETTTVGRLPESDIFLDDVTVSRRHAEFTRSGSSYEIRDVGSLNGTYVNGERVDRTELASGDEVQIGKFKLGFFSRE